MSTHADKLRYSMDTVCFTFVEAGSDSCDCKTKFHKSFRKMAFFFSELPIYWKVQIDTNIFVIIDASDFVFFSLNIIS